jgi:hypothetical protein
MSFFPLQESRPGRSGSRDDSFSAEALSAEKEKGEKYSDKRSHRGDLQP